MRLQILIFSFAVLLVLSACQPSENILAVELEKSMADDMADDNSHLGCSPEESPSGICVVAKESNSEIFDNLDESLTVTSFVEYAPNIKGFLARPANQGVYPAVIIIHEWWGLNDNIKTMAKLLAQEGYVVLAVDIYEGRVAENSSVAGQLAGEARANPEKGVSNMKSAVSYLKSLDFVDSGSIASLGWCFGGGQSLNLATSGENLQATVIYYGTLTNDTSRLEKISWPVLGIFGENDTGIPVSSVDEFESLLNGLNIKNEIYIYPNVGHAFANPSGARYAPDETKDAWKKTLAFLDNSLKD